MTTSAEVSDLLRNGKNSAVEFKRDDVGTASRETTREEETRLRQQAGVGRYEMRAVPQTGLGNLDLSLLDNYFRVVLRREAPKESGEWTRVLANLGFLDERAGRPATVAGLLLFGRNPNRQLPQAGIAAVSFPSRDEDGDPTDEEVIRGPLVSRLSTSGQIEEKGVIDHALDFVRRNVGTRAWLEGGRRRQRCALPPEAIREAVVNAVMHRDYAHETAEVEISLYRDRLEVVSPGRLPNGVTVERMKEGRRVPRNELLRDVLRDYRQVERLGMGVRNRIISAMRRDNCTEPELVEEEHRFTARLWKAPRGAPASWQPTEEAPHRPLLDRDPEVPGSVRRRSALSSGRQRQPQQDSLGHPARGGRHPSPSPAGVSR